MTSNTALESQLWEKVQQAYAKSRCYRAGDDPEYAAALAEYNRVANPQPANSNVVFLPIKQARARA